MLGGGVFMVDFPIDVVIPWVDGSDPQWRARKNALREKLDLPQDSGSSDVRYRDWNLLPYLFRGIEEYAPWVRKVFLITDHQVPSWLDQNCPKLQLIYHEDYIPQEYLPTFSSHTIELNLHRIADLSEHFIYMNDDTFIMNPVKPEFFFSKKGLPRTSAIVSPWRVLVGDYFFEPIVDAAVITRNFNFHKTVARHPGQWLTPRYGVNVFRTLFSLPYPYFVGFYEGHVPNAFLKSTFEEVWDKEYDVLDETCKHPFREITDVNQYLIREWQVASGNFKPRGPQQGKAFPLAADWRDQLDRLERFVASGRGKLACVNDSPDLDDFDAAVERTNQIFRQRLPRSCSFEKNDSGA